MISYYELLGMIKEGKAPKKIKVHLNSTPKVYAKEDALNNTFSYYGLVEEEKEDGDYKYYLAECFLESSMLNKTIEILEEKKKIPKKIEEEEIEVSMAIGEQICANKINEIIDYLKTKENKNGKSYDEG